MLLNTVKSLFRQPRTTRRNLGGKYSAVLGPQIQTCECRTLLSAVAGPVSIDGTSGNDLILVNRFNSSSTDILVTVNGRQSGPYRPVGPVMINGLAGNDTITVAADVTVSTVIDGGAGSDVIAGGMGDDTILCRDGGYDRIDTRTGIDRAATDSADVVKNVEYLNPMTTSSTNQSKSVKILVMNYEPRIPNEGNQTLWEFFNWSNPRDLAAGYEQDLERASGGAVDLEIVEWRDLNEFPAFEDGYRYTPAEYVQNRQTNSNWHEGNIDFPRIVRDNGIAAMIDSGAVDEVWFFTDHFFIPGGESWMAGPESFYINGPVFQEVETQRAFACMGFSYERSVAEMLHNNGHRTESTMNRIYGGWNLGAPTSNWDKFSANTKQSNGVAGVGTTHYAPNASSDYDTSNTRYVQSWADDFLNYPNLTGRTRPVNRSTWGKGTSPDYEREYQKWYFAHLPRATGVNADGKQNNWWKYLYDFNNYTATGVPKPLSATSMATPIYNTGGPEYTFSIAFSGAIPVDLSTLDGQDFRVTGPNDFNQLARLMEVSDNRDDTHIVAKYRITAPGGSWDSADFGAYQIQLQSGAVANVISQTLGGGVLDTFNVGVASAHTLPMEADTVLKLRFDGNTNGEAGETAVATNGLSFEQGRVATAAQTGAGGSMTFANSDNISADEGTIEFWIKPNWNGAGNSGHTFFQVGEYFNNGLLLSIDGADNLRFIRWGDNPATSSVEVDYETGVSLNASDWIAGEWHHFAATWNSAAREQALYIDGQLAGAISDAASFTTFAGTQMQIGRDTSGGSFADAAFDEFRISTKARSLSEIGSSYLAGTGIRSITVSAIKSSMQIGNQQSLRATAIGADGRTWDVTRLVQWTSSDARVINVDEKASVSAVGPGNAVVSARLTSIVGSTRLAVVDLKAPMATFTAADVNAFGGKTYDVSVRYTDNTGVLVNSLDNADLHVTGPNGFSGFLKLISKTPNANSNAVTAVYRLVPRGGYWDASDNGVYQISVLPGQIRDIQDRANGHRVVARFQVAIAPEILTPFAISETQRPVFQWGAVPGATGYAVQIYSLDLGRSQVVSTRVSVPKYSPSTALAYGNYEVQVRSEHPSGFFSKWSTPTKFQINKQQSGTSASDAFVLRFTSSGVNITQASGIGLPVNKGTFPLTIPVRLNNLTAADSVRVVGTNGSDAMSISGTGMNTNGVQIIVAGSPKITLAGAAGNDTYRFDVDSVLGNITLDESGGGTDTLDFSMTSSVGIRVNLGISAAQKIHPQNLLLALGSSSSFENIVGGSSDDTFVGNSLANVLVGNNGGDQLSGGGGRDILIGGAGLDNINGGVDDDILIAGRTVVDQMFSRLVDLSNTWRSSDAYSTRLTKIRAGVGPSLTSLKAKVNVLGDPGQPDSLRGEDGNDWYFRAVDDVLSGLVTGESIDLL